LDDLAFDMYQDPEVAHIIRLLDQKKQNMVRQENFEQAKNLKQAIADLQKVSFRRLTDWQALLTIYHVEAGLLGVGLTI